MNQISTTRKASGFTLIELIIVVSILGILAAIVVPKFSDASDLARQSALKEDLRNLRTQIELYKTQHDSVCPGYPGGNEAAAATQVIFIDQLTKFTDANGNVSETRSSSYPFGPYLGSMPVNHISQNSDIKIVSGAFPATASGNEGWVYQASSGKVCPNISGIDSNDKLYFDY